MPKLGLLSFVKTHKRYKQTKIFQEKAKKLNLKMAVILFQIQSQLHEENVKFLFL